MVYAMIFIPITTASVVFCGRFITAKIKYFIVALETKVMKRDKIKWFQTKIITIQVLLNLVFMMLQAKLYHHFGLQKKGLFDAVYFVFITTTTLGFGDLRLDSKVFFDMTLTGRWCFGLSTFCLFYISFSLLASIINSCVSFGTDSSYKKFKIENMVSQKADRKASKQSEVEVYTNEAYKEEA